MTPRSQLLLTLFTTFAPLSLATIGGGQSIVAEVQRQSVEVHHWLDPDDFVSLFALSRLLPGPGSLLVTLMGWAAAGWVGGLVASVAIFVPSSLLVYGLAHLWRRHRGARWQRAVEQGLAPLAAGLILSASITLLRAVPGGWMGWGLALLSTALMTATRLSPLLMLLAGAALFAAAGVR